MRVPIEILLIIYKHQLKTFFSILLAAFFASCVSVPPAAPDAGPLKLFFARCRSDMVQAKKVIVDHDLVKNLTHLLRMNNGGDKYYLLEKESITMLIRSVTEGAYADFILVNEQGTVVYAMMNHALFAKNVLAALKNTSLKACYENRNAGLYIGPSSLLPDDRAYTIAVSSLASGTNTLPGTFIMIIDISKIREVVGDNTSIVDSSGTYIIAGDYSKINAHYRDFEKINLSRPEGEKTAYFTGAAGRVCRYTVFRHDDLLWILVSE